MPLIQNRPTLQLFHSLANKIVETFPTEKREVWAAYTVTSSGIEAGKFLSPHVWSRIKEDMNKKFEDGEKDLLNLCKEVESKHETGETNWEEVWPTLEVLWSNTTKYRIEKLHNSLRQSDIFRDYFKKYPFLAEPKGYTLLEKDFEYLYPKATCNLFAEWPKLSSFFEKELNDKIYKSIKHTNPERRMMNILTSLSWLFPVLSVKKKWCPSRHESQLTFLLVIKKYESLKRFVDTRASKLSSVGVKHLPPFAVVVGNEKKIKASYVIFDKAVYKVDNPLKAIDLTFKMFCSLKIPYPPECMQIWTFLQQAVYKIVTKEDRKHPMTSELISKYEKFKCKIM